MAVLRNWEQFQNCSVSFYTPCRNEKYRAVATGCVGGGTAPTPNICSWVNSGKFRGELRWQANETARICSKRPHESEHEWTRDNTSEHESKICEHEWTRVKNLWTRVKNWRTRVNTSQKWRTRGNTSQKRILKEAPYSFKPVMKVCTV
jgi:hypothetical protein